MTAVTLKMIRDRCKDDGGCWVWQQSLNNKGCPQMSINNKGGQMVRRVAFQLAGKRIKNGYVVYSTCGDRRCCNPEHLAQITRGERTSLSYKLGERNAELEYPSRMARAISCGLSKLGLNKAREIRARLMDGANKAALAREYGVHEKTIYNIDRNNSWRDALAGSSIFGRRAA